MGKNKSALWLGLLGLAVFALLILVETFIGHVELKFWMLAAGFGVLLSGELILVGLGRGE